MELLKNLYSIHSMSRQEEPMRKFIKKYIKENFPGVDCVQDHKNLYITKGVASDYPCVVAHLDQVQTKHSPDFRVLELDGRLFGFSAMNARQEGLGADDKNGIWVALKCIEMFHCIKVAFFWGEEIGCCGSSEANMGFFKDCRFAIQADRRNGGDLITDISGPICSDEFKADIAHLCEKHGYKETSGLMTDVETLSDNGLGLSCINVSCGYYKPHTDEEFTDVVELWNCLHFVSNIIKTCTKVYAFERPKRAYFYGGSSHYIGSSYQRSYGRYLDDYDDYDWKDYYGYNNSFKKKDEVVKEPEIFVDEDEDIFIPDFKDYSNAEDAVEDFIIENMEKSNPYQLWDYISSDCETYGITYEFYCQMVDFYCEYYDEQNEEAEVRVG